MNAKARRHTWNVVFGVTVLFVFAIGGEYLRRLVELPVPGSILGMLALLLVLFSPLGERLERQVSAAAWPLIGVLPLLLIPTAAGIVDEATFLGPHLGVLALSIGCGWVVAIVTAVAAWRIVEWVARRRA